MELGLGVTNEFNNLNQIKGSTVNVGRVTVLGEVNYPMGTVTVSGVQAVLHGTTFEAANVPVAPGSNTLTAIYYGPGFTNVGHIATDTVSVVISNRVYQHDADGNLTNDSVFAYAWDAANQLTNVVRLAGAQRVLSMRYDALGRRVQVTRGDNSVERYVYIPGTFLVLAILDGDNEVKEMYTHGPDLSGTLGGAGGIGGVLCAFHAGDQAARYFHADANGNIVMATDETGDPVAIYRYTPFGREIQRDGGYVARYGFSSKEFDPETGLVYFGFRYYSPKMGRWINRDPIREAGGGNMYGFVGNATPQSVDPFGLEPLWVWWVLDRDGKAKEHAEKFRKKYDSVPRDCRSAGLCEKPVSGSRRCRELRHEMDGAYLHGTANGIGVFMAVKDQLQDSLQLAKAGAQNQANWIGYSDSISEEMLNDPIFASIVHHGGDPLFNSRVYNWLAVQKPENMPGVTKAYAVMRSNLENSFATMRNQWALLVRISRQYVSECCCPCPKQESTESSQ